MLLRIRRVSLLGLWLLPLPVLSAAYQPGQLRRYVAAGALHGMLIGIAAWTVGQQRDAVTRDHERPETLGASALLVSNGAVASLALNMNAPPAGGAWLTTQADQHVRHAALVVGSLLALAGLAVLATRIRDRGERRRSVFSASAAAASAALFTVLFLPLGKGGPIWNGVDPMDQKDASFAAMIALQGRACRTRGWRGGSGGFMPITHTVDKARLLLSFAVSGTVTTEEMLATVDNAVRSLGEGRYRVLSDHRALITPATTPQLEALVTHLTRYRALFGGTRWAVVVGRPASFGMMRMLSVLAERIPIEVAVFTDPVEAERWLG